MKTLESRLVLIMMATFFVFAVAFFYLPFLPWNFHGPSGLVAAVLTVLHVVMNRKVLIHYAKSIKNKKLPKRAKFNFYLDMTMLFVWGVAALSGISRLLQRLFLRQVLEATGPYPDSILVPIHLWFSLATIALIIVHFILHIPHIKAGLKSKNKG